MRSFFAGLNRHAALGSDPVVVAAEGRRVHDERVAFSQRPDRLTVVGADDAVGILVCWRPSMKDHAVAVP